MSKYKRIAMLVSSLGLILLVVGVSYSFFNYTRTGTVNNLGTGQIYFNTTEVPTLNLTNLFPMTSIEAANANLDSVSVVIEGNTTYSDGEEYEITLVDVTNTVNGKSIPLNYTATYTPNTDKVIGTPSADYWNAREDKDANIYTLNASGEVTEGKQVLVGYVDNGATGIEGTLTIKAYIDKDKIAISDTYADGHQYLVNSNMTVTEINDCVSYLTSQGVDEHLLEGETLNDFCAGTGTLYSDSFQEVLDANDFSDEEIEYLLGHNIIISTDGYDTPVEWVNNRVVLTANEWNSLSTTPISFKIRAESNEGIWVSPQIETCIGCKYMFIADTPMYTTWNLAGRDETSHLPIAMTPTAITSGLYDNYLELIRTTNKDYFLGVKLNSNNEVTNAYACGVKSNKPFCLEGTLGHDLGPSQAQKIYLINRNFLQSDNMYNNTCINTVINPGSYSEYLKCGPWDGSNVISSATYSSGLVEVGTRVTGENTKNCSVSETGLFGCDLLGHK